MLTSIYFFISVSFLSFSVSFFLSFFFFHFLFTSVFVFFTLFCSMFYFLFIPCGNLNIHAESRECWYVAATLKTVKQLTLWHTCNHKWKKSHLKCSSFAFEWFRIILLHRNIAGCSNNLSAKYKLAEQWWN